MTTISTCLGFARHYIPSESLEVTFDQSEEREPTTAALYKFLLNVDSIRALLHEDLRFGDHRKCVPLQIADLVAYESMKQLDNRLAPRRRWARGSFLRLRTNRRFHFQVKDENALLALHSHLILFDSDNPIIEMYERWRNHHHLPESMMSRLKFMTASDREHFVDDRAAAYVEQLMRHQVQ